MRLLLKQKIVKTLNIMQEAQQTIFGDYRNRKNELWDILAQLQQRVVNTAAIIECEIKENEEFILPLEQYCEYLYQITLHMESKDELAAIKRKINSILNTVFTLIDNEEIEIEIAFLPYKYSMWDSLESIWDAASKDTRCKCKIIPIPYFDRDGKGNLTKLCYEGEMFAEKMDIVDYQDYDLKKEKPDIVYIHNPYDDMNSVTCVEPRFFSEEIKKQGSILVYVPYYMAGYGSSFETAEQTYLTKGAIYSDYIVLQSENLARAYEYCGFKRAKLLVTGNPKADYIYKLKKKPIEAREAWKKIIGNRKVVFLNSSLSYFLNNENWFLGLESMIDAILQDREIVLLWRPHPLLEQTCLSIKREQMDNYQKLCKKIENAENGIIDRGKDAADAICVSDGMISDYSSLIMQYAFTEKPTLLVGIKEMNPDAIVYCDCFYTYYMEAGFGVTDFVKMIKEEKDIKKEERMKRLYKSIENPNGRCGTETHKAIMEKVL